LTIIVTGAFTGATVAARRPKCAHPLNRKLTTPI
jgi:hypothetical protein